MCSPGGLNVQSGQQQLTSERGQGKKVTRPAAPARRRIVPPMLPPLNRVWLEKKMQMERQGKDSGTAEQHFDEKKQGHKQPPRPAQWQNTCRGTHTRHVHFTLAHVCTHARTHARTRTHTSHAHALVHARTHARTHAHAHVACACTGACTHARIRMHAQTQSRDG